MIEKGKAYVLHTQSLQITQWANNEIVAGIIRSLISLEAVGQYMGMVMKIKLISNIKCGIGSFYSE